VGCGKRAKQKRKKSHEMKTNRYIIRILSNGSKRIAPFYFSSFWFPRSLSKFTHHFSQERKVLPNYYCFSCLFLILILVDMAFLSTNRYRDSWAYRNQHGGFTKGPTRNDGNEENAQSATLGRSATTDTLETLNKSLSQLQFNSRPNTPNNNRNIRPSSAGASRVKINQNPNNRRSADPQTHLKADLISDPDNLNDVQYFDEITGNRYKDSWPARTGTANNNGSDNRENFASNTQTLKLDPSKVTLNPKSLAQTPLSKVPRFVETDKQVLRFYCHFFDKETQITHHPDLLKVKHPSTARLFTLLVYLNDFTVEIVEDKQVNSGHRGGQFFKRNYLKKDGGGELAVQDLAPGRSLPLLGHDFFITDCDVFTRGYFR
jgi:hypothetical protein